MYAGILVPLDGSPFSECAIPHAKMVASGSGAEIMLLKAVINPLTRIPEISLPDEPGLMEGIIEDAKAYLEHVAAGLRAEGYRVRCDVVEGEPEDVILGYAHREGVDLVVMGTHGRSGLSRMLMGSVAEKVMHATRRPVMLVKPDLLPLHRTVADAAHIGAH
jgi:nucleotide-binding universal stress UspA family protein